MGPCLGPYPSLIGLGKGLKNSFFKKLCTLTILRHHVLVATQKCFPHKNRFPGAQIHIKDPRNHGAARLGEGIRAGAEFTILEKFG